MSKNRPHDRLGEIDVDGKNDSGVPEIYAVKKGVSPADVSRRGFLAMATAALAASAVEQVAQAEGCSAILAHKGAVIGLAVSADGRTLLTASKDGTVKFWSLPAGGHFKTLSVPSLQAIAALPNNQFVTSSKADDTLTLWSESGARVGTLPGHNAAVRAFVADPAGAFVVSASEDGTIHIVDIKTKVPKTLTGHSGSVRCLALSPSRMLLASGGDDRTVRLWSFPSGQLVHVLTGHTAAVQSLAFSSDGTTLASASADKSIRFWTLPAGSDAGVFQDSDGEVNCVVFAPTKKTVYCGDSAGILSELPLGTRAYKHPELGESITCLCLSGDAGKLIVGGAKGTVQLWRVGDRLTYEVCLIDLSVNATSVKGIQYRVNGVLFTLPCGTPIPPDAVCVCNCVPGLVNTAPTYYTTYYTVPTYYRTPTYYTAPTYYTTPTYYSTPTYYTTPSYYTTYYTVTYTYPN